MHAVVTRDDEVDARQDSRLAHPHQAARRGAGERRGGRTSGPGSRGRSRRPPAAQPEGEHGILGVAGVHHGRAVGLEQTQIGLTAQGPMERGEQAPRRPRPRQLDRRPSDPPATARRPRSRRVRGCGPGPRRPHAPPGSHGSRRCGQGRTVRRDPGTAACRAGHGWTAGTAAAGAPGRPWSAPRRAVPRVDRGGRRPPSGAPEPAVLVDPGRAPAVAGQPVTFHPRRDRPHVAERERLRRAGDQELTHRHDGNGRPPSSGPRPGPTRGRPLASRRPPGVPARPSHRAAVHRPGRSPATAAGPPRRAQPTPGGQPRTRRAAPRRGACEADRPPRSR